MKQITYYSMLYCMVILLQRMRRIRFGFPRRSAITEDQIVDLSSDHDWQLSIDDGPWRSVRVPGGGYNSDLQDEPLINATQVKDHVTYKRTVNIRELAPGKAVRIEFGGVNHGCDIYFDDKLVGSHTGPMMPFEDRYHGTYPAR